MLTKVSITLVAWCWQILVSTSAAGSSHCGAFCHVPAQELSDDTSLMQVGKKLKLGSNSQHLLQSEPPNKEVEVLVHPEQSVAPSLVMQESVVQSAQAKEKTSLLQGLLDAIPGMFNRIADGLNNIMRKYVPVADVPHFKAGSDSVYEEGSPEDFAAGRSQRIAAAIADADADSIYQGSVAEDYAAARSRRIAAAIAERDTVRNAAALKAIAERDAYRKVAALKADAVRNAAALKAIA